MRTFEGCDERLLPDCRPMICNMDVLFGEPNFKRLGVSELEAA
jgi:hypothetical protein